MLHHCRATEEDTGGRPVILQARSIELSEPLSASSTFLAALLPPGQGNCAGKVGQLGARRVTDLDGVLNPEVRCGNSARTRGSLLRQGVNRNVAQGFEVPRRCSSIVVGLHLLQDGKGLAGAPLHYELAHQRALRAGVHCLSWATSPGANQLQRAEGIRQVQAAPPGSGPQAHSGWSCEGQVPGPGGTHRSATVGQPPPRWRPQSHPSTRCPEGQAHRRCSGSSP